MRRLGVRIPLRSRHFCLKNFDTFPRTPVRVSKMNAVARTQLTFQLLTILQRYLYHQSQYSTTRESKCLALIAQWVRAFGMNPKFGGSGLPQVETFCVSKTLTLSQENPLVCRCPRIVNISNVNFTSKIPMWIRVIYSPCGSVSFIHHVDPCHLFTMWIRVIYSPCGSVSFIHHVDLCHSFTHVNSCHSFTHSDPCHLFTMWICVIHLPM